MSHYPLLSASQFWDYSFQSKGSNAQMKPLLFNPKALAWRMGFRDQKPQ
jgi:hypothetical protein